MQCMALLYPTNEVAPAHLLPCEQRRSCLTYVLAPSLNIQVLLSIVALNLDMNSTFVDERTLCYQYLAHLNTNLHGLEMVTKATYPDAGSGWAPHQATITRLYRDEDRSLGDVMVIMAEEHGLKAT